MSVGDNIVPNQEFVAPKVLEKLLEVSQTLLSTRDPQLLLSKIAATAGVVLAADVIALYEYREETHDVTVPPVVWGEIRHPEVLQGIGRARPHKESAVFKVLESGQPFYASNAREDWARIIEGWSQKEGRPGNFVHREGIVSSAAVPLTVERERVGVLFVNYRSRQTFSGQERGIIELIASQAAVAIQNARLLTDLERRIDEHRTLYADLERQVIRLQTLNQISRELSAKLDDKAIFGTVTKAVVRTLDCTHCTIFTVEEDVLLPRASHGKDHDVRISRRLALGEGLAGWAAQQGQPILTRNARKNARSVRGKTRPDVERSRIVVPFKVDGQVVGVISADQDRVSAFDEQDLQMVETVAIQTGIALQNVSLIRRERRRADVMDLLRKISTTISTPLDIKKALDLAIHGALQLTETDVGVIHLIDDAGQAISHSHEFPAGSGHLASRFAQRTGLTWEAFKTGEIVEALDVPWSKRVSPALAQSGVKSLIGVPLKQDNRVIGVLFLNCLKERGFTADDKNLLTMLAEQAALAIGQSRQRVQDISALQEINEAILQRELDDVTHLIAEKATTITRANYATLRLVDESGKYLRAKAVKGRDSKQEYLPIDENTFTGWVALRGKAALCPDVKEDTHYVEWYPDVNSCMAVPLKRGDKTIGTLYVESTQPGAFSERYQLDLLQSLAHQAAIAIENARLVHELDERAERLVRLQQVTATISAEPSDLERVLHLIADSLGSIFRGASCAIRLYDPAQDEFGPRVAVGVIQGLVDHPPRPQGTSRHIIQTRAPLYVEDASITAPNEMPTLRREVVALGIKAAAYLPLLLKGEVIGILYVDLTEPRQFSQYDKQILELFAYQAAIAIENARKYEELRDTYEELRRTRGLVGSRTAVAWMGMINSTWRHAIEGHAVNILNAVHLLRQNLSTGVDDETVERRLRTIERLARKIQEKPITPPISSEEGVHSLCINNLVRERVQQLWRYPPHSAVTCQWDLATDEEVTVRASPEWLRRALDILLDNAVEAMEESPAKKLTIATQRADGRVRLTIADTGPGIPPRIKAQLFHSPIEKSPGEKGLGMGLLMAQMIAQTYRGDICVGHTGPEGTAMVLELPIED